MADVNKLVPIIFKWEGGWSDHQADKGGKTNMGITLQTWKSCGYDKDGDGDIDSDDLKMVTKQDVVNLLKKHYWDRWKADQIKSQSVANIVVDWVWNSGAHGITRVQKLLKVTADGIVGAKTLEALNSRKPEEMFNEIKEDRIRFFHELVKKDSSQKVFLNGWLNRVNDFKFEKG